MCFTIGIAFSRNYASVIIFRFLGGLAASPVRIKPAGVCLRCRLR